jgi:hypothetical protein
MRAEAVYSGYKRCLLVEVQRKGVKLTAAALKTLVKSIPRVRDGATGAVLREWRLRTLPLQRTLVMSGLENCGEIVQAEDGIYAEMREWLKKVLARKHTFEELLQFTPLWDAGQLGDLAPRLLAAWNVFLPNGPDPFVLE